MDKTTALVTGVLEHAKKDLARFAQVLAIATPHELNMLERINNCPADDDDGAIMQAMVRAAIGAARKLK